MERLQVGGLNGGLTAKEIENCIDIWEEHSITKFVETEIDRSKVPIQFLECKGRNPLLVLHILNIKEWKSENKLLDQPKVPESAVPTAWCSIS